MSKTILSVDDSASALQMIKLTLAGAGYQIVQAVNGADGLAKARTGAIDMVITDLGVFAIDKKAGGMTLIEVAPGVSLDEIKSKTEASYKVGVQAAAA